MKFYANLEENEKVTELGIAKALVEFVQETNEFYGLNQYKKPISVEDIADVLKIVSLSDRKWGEWLNKVQNEKS